MDYKIVSIALAEMLGLGYTHEWIRHLMDTYRVPQEYGRPVPPKSKYIFCKELFEKLQKDDPIRARQIVTDIATYIIDSERFDQRFEAQAMKHLPVFRNTLNKAGFRPTQDKSMVVNPIFNTRDFVTQDNMCFVLMPFTQSWSTRIYSKILVPIIKKCSLEPVRADNLFGHDVMEDIWSAINSAFIIVADVTGRNPNVFYELGIAHTLGKNVIVITQDKSDVPFDIQGLRFIEYADNQDGYEILENQLSRFLQSYKPKE